MIYHLFWYFRHFITDNLGFYAWQNVMFRSIAALLASFILALVIAPKIIRYLLSKKIGDSPDFDNATINELTKDKANTPTMGGIIILIATLSTVLLWAKLNNPFIQKAVIVMLWFGAIGAADDWLKLTSRIKHRSRNGLIPWEKLLFQIGGAVLIASFLYYDFANITRRQEVMASILQARPATGQRRLYLNRLSLHHRHKQRRQLRRWYGRPRSRTRRYRQFRSRYPLLRLF